MLQLLHLQASAIFLPPWHKNLHAAQSGNLADFQSEQPYIDFAQHNVYNNILGDFYG